MPFKSKKEIKRAWRKANPEKIRMYENKSTARAKNIIIGLLGDQCKKCGIKDMRVLQIDHVYGGGTELRKNGIRGTRQVLAYIRKNGTKGFQILCANCNWIKRFENKERNYAVQK